MQRSRKLVYALVGAVLVLGGAGAVYLSQGSKGSASYTPGEPVARRLTAEQYRTIIADVFGPTVEIGGRFEPDMRVNGLLAVGTSQVSVSAAGMEQYDAMARAIASQVLGEPRRKLMLTCTPAAPDAPDPACAGEFLSRVGKLLFRRPLTSEEHQQYVEAANRAAETLGDFHTGLSLSLAAMLASPQFLFRQERLEPDPEHPGQYRLDPFSKAARLSFFLWNAAPDLQLLEAAEQGELNTRRGLERQVERLLSSPRLESGVRAFFADMLEFSEFETLTKDAVIYPKFNPKVAADAQEQTLKTIVQHLLTERGDYRELFTTRKTFLTQNLASIYRVPLVNDVPNGSPDTWQPYEFAQDDPRAGIVMQASFVTLHSHPGRSSPTLRGAALREILLCQKIPSPPAAVDFQIVQDTSNPVHKTARSRLEAHATVASCAGCHKIMDPIGLALENFDGGGEWRERENGVAIDTSGELDGKSFANGAELGKVVGENPAATACLVDRLSSYALGRVPASGEKSWIDRLKQEFAEVDYVVPDLMRQIATSEEFYRASAPKVDQTSVTAMTTAAGAGS